MNLYHINIISSGPNFDPRAENLNQDKKSFENFFWIEMENLTCSIRLCSQAKIRTNFSSLSKIFASIFIQKVEIPIFQVMVQNDHFEVFSVL